MHVLTLKSYSLKVNDFNFKYRNRISTLRWFNYLDLRIRPKDSKSKDLGP